jgi:hypothetical protein
MTEKSLLQDITPEQTLINQHLQRLDEVSRKMEAKWGVNRLPDCVPKDLREKWDRQWLKLNAAIMESKHPETVELAQGCIRAWEALERAAVVAGYQHDTGQVMEIRAASGRIYRVCASGLDAMKPVPEGYQVVSLSEVVNLLEANQLVNTVKDNSAKFSNKEIIVPPDEFWKSGGDSIPF